MDAPITARAFQVKPKTYPVEKVSEVAKALAEAPPLPPRFIAHSETLSELSKHIRELHFKKNYDHKQITEILRENGIKTTQKEVKEVLGIGRKKKSTLDTSNDA